MTVLSLTVWVLGDMYCVCQEWNQAPNELQIINLVCVISYEYDVIGYVNTYLLPDEDYLDYLVVRNMVPDISSY